MNHQPPPEDNDDAWIQDTFKTWRRTIFPSPEMKQSLRMRLEQVSGDERMIEPPIENMIKQFFHEIGHLLQRNRDEDDQ